MSMRRAVEQAFTEMLADMTDGELAWLYVHADDTMPNVLRMIRSEVDRRRAET